MTDEQFKEIRKHLRFIIALLGGAVGVLISIAWDIHGLAVVP
jgi:hypothetical protein